jgi:hypothetical protein
MTGQQTELEGVYSVSGDRVTGQWLTLKEASVITGKSINALTLLINRKKIDRVRKVKGKGGGKWLIHKDSLHLLMELTLLPCQSQEYNRVNTLSEATEYDRATVSIPLEHYDKKRDEWDRERDRLTQGIMMYQYKLEEYERKLKLLPAPPEVVTSKLQEQEIMLQTKDQAIRQKEEALARAQEILKKAKESYDQYKASMVELKAKLVEEERTREAYRIQWELAQAELKRPWWKKLFGMKM